MNLNDSFYLGVCFLDKMDLTNYSLFFQTEINKLHGIVVLPTMSLE